MPTSATGTWTSKPRQQGFTLLEVMVTVVLIGIMTGLAMLSFRGNAGAERLTTEAERLARLVALNHQEAIFLSEVRGVRFTAQSYEFLTMDDAGRWRPVTESTLLTQRQLPENLDLRLRVNGKAVALTAHSPLPQVLLMPSGESTDFDLTLGAEYLRGYTIAGDLVGNLSIAPIP